MRREDVEVILSAADGMTYGEWLLVRGIIDQEFEAMHRDVALAPPAARSAQRLIDQAMGWYEPGCEMPAQTAMKLEGR